MTTTLHDRLTTIQAEHDRLLAEWQDIYAAEGPPPKPKPDPENENLVEYDDLSPAYTAWLQDRHRIAEQMYALADELGISYSEISDKTYPSVWQEINWRMGENGNRRRARVS